MSTKYSVAEKYYKPLESVATPGTVALVWCRSYTGVLHAINLNHFAARKCGKTWLISLPSVVAYWGDPPTLSGVKNNVD